MRDIAYPLILYPYALDFTRIKMSVHLYLLLNAHEIMQMEAQHCFYNPFSQDTGL